MTFFDHSIYSEPPAVLPRPSLLSDPIELPKRLSSLIVLSMEPKLPPELRIHVVEGAIALAHPYCYSLPEDIIATLKSLALVERAGSSTASRLLYRHVVIPPAQITDLLNAGQHLKYVESLALLPAPYNTAGQSEMSAAHPYCLDTLAPLLSALAPTLKRLCIVHRPRNQPSCWHWPQAIATLTSLEELVVDNYQGIFPHRLHRTPARALRAASRRKPRPPPSSNNDDSIEEANSRMDVNDYVEEDGSSEDYLDIDDDIEHIVPTWPYLPNLRRLAISSHSILWQDYKFTDFFPRIQHLVHVHSGFIEDWPSQARSMRRQMRHNPNLRVVLVEEDRAYLKRDWQEDIAQGRLPRDRFLFHVYEQSDAPSQSAWLIKHALEGGIFDVGTQFDDLRASPEPDQ